MVDMEDLKAQLEELYHTDDISVTSTLPSDVGETYEVEAVLSEDLWELEDDSTEMRYLLKWEGYPMHR
jgi:hypothetical protein